MIATDNSTGDLRIGSSSYIDFALWILVQDGLQVAPFDKHTGGNQILQSLGMTPESWYEWLKLILIHQDNRLGWHVPNIDSEVKENVESFKKMIGIMSKAQNIEDNTVYDQQWYDSQNQHYSKLLIDQEAGYQEALADYQGLNTNSIRESNPPQLYQGNPQVQERLTLLWDDYNSNHHSNKFINETLVIPEMWDVQENPPTDKYREMYLVDYPYEVELFIPPIFAIVTVPNRPVNQVHLEQRMFSIIQNS
jgi:hypothetical protein